MSKAFTPHNFLLIRFRQMGDAVLITPVLDTLRRTFPDARIDVVLNERLAPLFANHPSHCNVITFTEQERHNLFAYVSKVWRITHAVRYDAVLDFRSTTNTLLFSLFSLRSSLRAGVAKSYTRWVLNHRVGKCGQSIQMIDHNLQFLQPLERICPLKYTQRPSLSVTEAEHEEFKAYMQQCGIDFNRPVMLAAVTAKLAHKAWNQEYMTDVLRRFLNTYPDVQIVLNYAPGHEETEARAMAEILNHKNLFLNVEAKGIRKLMAMVSCCTFYFGNEGGTRHIADALGIPTFSICSPVANRFVWIPVNDIHHQAVSCDDFATQQQLAAMTYEQRYALITPDAVWGKLVDFIGKNGLSFE